ncbi:hypothetical protein Q5424_04940 [Conexibacter sp. JD483]|uniref:hypothetical protein n=1 Tax=unclassified Conexibacter TaxID=2627773 RepID=UPI00271ED82C|nr:MULTISPECIES: hypothetical protein [unclassified Conexibacter]MDO8184679.1 hypothetical protein [Conexibacter sp. CPCC 205706]MDO8197985.1 hypothetical protein [Conexibacter sp. CPCC 205762]MDR9368415.1 hypothetical protein [Conexibacter sp. JD483]
MTPFEHPYAHYVAYGSTDQSTFIALRRRYDGLVVPATIAAYQRHGTGGFVLTLSATSDSPPYVIDPRFPLFQQKLVAPKKSHEALAELLDDPSLVVDRGAPPATSAFPDARVQQIARKWVEFNTAYETANTNSFSKYARRLKEPVREADAKGPEAILPPYFACGGVDDPWWERSKLLYAETCAAARETALPCYRVVCAVDSSVLDSLISELARPERIVLWASGLDEHNVEPAKLVAYRDAIVNAAAQGHAPFGLYGGFFSVLLGTFGLRGSSHGVGFSEHRAWEELPSAGAAPARYYLRRAHRYVMQDLAQQLHEASPDLTSCPCPHCNDRAPFELDYHELMKHSVWCRAEEIAVWAAMDTATAADALQNEFQALTIEINQAQGIAPATKKKARRSIEHLPRWVAALS